MHRRHLFARAVATLSLVILPNLAVAQRAGGYPDRPITLVVPWGAGGGTDATARIVASLLEDELGQRVNVVNRTGGSGVVGHTAIARAQPDGYTLGLATVEIGMMHWQGLTDLTHQEYTPIALMNEDPAAVQVESDSPHQTIQDLVQQIRAQPGRLQASGTGQGGIWHLAIAGMLDDLGLGAGAVIWVPSDGSAAGLRDLVAGGVQIVASSLPEARSLIDAGRVRSLAIMAADRADLFPDVPTLEEEVGSDWQIGSWRGIVGPKGLPPEVVTVLGEALQNVYNSDEYREFMAAQGYGVRWLAGQDFGAFMAQSDERLGQVMRTVGITQ